MRLPVLILALLLAPSSCSEPSPVQIRDAWARDTVGRTGSAAVFMAIEAPASDRLIGASTSVSEKTDLMTMAGGGGSMQMKYVDGIDIPAGKVISLDPNGLHVWLANLHQPLRTGQKFPLTLRFRNAGERHLEVSVISPAAVPPSSSGKR